jgi:hypothetical protein
MKNKPPYTKEIFFTRIAHVSGDNVCRVVENLIRDFTEFGCYIDYSSKSPMAFLLAMPPDRNTTPWYFRIEALNTQTKVSFLLHNFCRPRSHMDCKEKLLELAAIPNFVLKDDNPHTISYVDAKELQDVAHYQTFLSTFKSVFRRLDARVDRGQAT